MSDDPQKEPRKEDDTFLAEVARKTARKLKAQRDGPQGVWFGLGMTGRLGGPWRCPCSPGRSLACGWTATIPEATPGRSRS